MAIDKSLVSGSTAMLIMKLLESKDMYGYEMIDLLSQRSQNVFDLKAGTLYPLLHALVKEGCLESYEEAYNGKTRKYYHLTSVGSKKLSTKECEWKEYANAIMHVMGGAYCES
ncbi:PadR family transcriptional regulator [Lachnospiraceae bacterium LCP25S3_G4]